MEHRNKGACVTGLFVGSSRGRWRATRRVLGVRQFVILERGAAVAETESGRWAMAAGSILAIPPGEPYAVRFSRGARGRVVRVLERVLLERVAPVMPEPSPVFWKTYATPGRFRFWEGGAKQVAREQFFRELDSVCKHLMPAVEGVVVGYLMVIMFRWLDIFTASRDDDGARGQAITDAELVDRFCALVERTLAARTTVAAYSRMLGVSKSRLARACAEAAGRSPLEILHDRLVLEARRELVYSDAGIAEIAASLGFGNANYFVRFFAKRVGVTPLQFRASGGQPPRPRLRPERSSLPSHTPELRA